MRAAPSPLPMRIMADVPGRSSPALADQPMQLAGQARGVRYAADKDRPRRRALPLLLAMTPPTGQLAAPVMLPSKIAAERCAP